LVLIWIINARLTGKNEHQSNIYISEHPDKIYHCFHESGALQKDENLK
jgi:hypothetical protein